jgi:ABC-2 type transport system ATP-binding protein
MRMLVGLSRPDAGAVRIADRPVSLGAPVLRRVGVLIDGPAFVPHLSGAANLRLLWRAAGREWPPPGLDDALDLAGLGAALGRRVRGYSMGMKQRLMLAQALMRQPDVLVLDEPATGLDPAGMRDMRMLFRDLGRRGITVLLSSHQMMEVEELCNRVAIIRSGRIAYEGSLADLRNRAGVSYRLRTTDDARAREVCSAQPGIDLVETSGTTLAFKAFDESAVAALSVALAESGAPVVELAPQQATLEDLFFQLTEGDGVPRAASTEHLIEEMA